MATNHNPNSSVQTLKQTTFRKMKLTDMLPALKVVAHQWGLKLSRPHDMRVAIRVCSHSVKNN